MPLPNQITSTYTMEIPSTKQKVKFRPWLVKEEKIILVAMQEMNGNINVVLDAIRTIVSNCTFGVLDTNKLTSYDLEYIFLELKKKSSGAIQDLAFTCQNNIYFPDPVNPSGPPMSTKCGHLNPMKLDLNIVSLVSAKDRSNKVMLSNTMGLTLRDATLAEATQLEESLKKQDILQIYEMTYKLVDTIFDGPTIYKDYTTEELRDFIDNLSSDQFQKIRDFFESVPTLQAKLDVCCAKCGYKETVTLEGLQSFLA